MLKLYKYYNEVIKSKEIQKMTIKSLSLAVSLTFQSHIEKYLHITILPTKLNYDIQRYPCQKFPQKDKN